jgi:endonuclease III
MLKTKSEISLILDKIVNIYPNAKTELNYKTPFQFIIAVILSAQTTDRQVNKVTNNFFKIVKNAEDITKLSLLEIEQNLKSINFYKNKSRFIKLC